MLVIMLMMQSHWQKNLKKQFSVWKNSHIEGQKENEDANGHAVQMSLLSICASFARYFSHGNADPKKDMLLFTNCTLVLTDEEFSGFLLEINEIALKYMKVEASEHSKTRQITLISAPTDEGR